MSIGRGRLYRQIIHTRQASVRALTRGQERLCSFPLWVRIFSYVSHPKSPYPSSFIPPRIVWDLPNWCVTLSVRKQEKSNKILFHVLYTASRTSTPNPPTHTHHPIPHIRTRNAARLFAPPYNGILEVSCGPLRPSMFGIWKPKEK